MIYIKEEIIKASNYILINDATSFPVTLQEAKDYLKISGSDQDAEINQLIATATDIGEKITGRDFLNKTYKGFLDYFPCGYTGIEIRKSKLQSITSIKYLKSKVLTTLDSSNYYTTQSNDYSSIFLNDGFTYPETDIRNQVVEIVFTAGYGDTSADIPETLKKAILTNIAYLFENKGDCDGCGSNKVSRKIYQAYIISSLLFRVL